jgi:hypothetical protein
MDETPTADKNQRESAKLSEAILALRESLPHLEKSLSEIGELKVLIGDLRERLLKKEEEVRGAIAKHASVMEKVSGGSQKDLTALLNHKQSESKSEGEGDENLLSDDDASDGVEGQTETERKKEEDEEGAKVYFEEDTSSAIALQLRDPQKLAEMEETLVAEQTVKSLRYALSKRQQSIEKALSKTRDSLRSGLGVEAQCGQVDEVREELRCTREETGPLLVHEAEKMMAEQEACEAEARVLDGRVADLLAAMRWGQSETGGLYRPSVCTAPVMMLLFEQYCRQHVSFKRLKKGEMSECVTAAWLRHCGCTGGGLREAGYDAAEAREGGYTLLELTAAGYDGCALKTEHRVDDEEYRNKVNETHRILEGLRLSLKAKLEEKETVDNLILKATREKENYELDLKRYSTREQFYRATNGITSCRNSLQRSEKKLHEIEELISLLQQQIRESDRELQMLQSHHEIVSDLKA